MDYLVVMMTGKQLVVIVGLIVVIVLMMKMKRSMKMKMWKITGNDLPPFYLYADSFDEALRLARIINPDYNTGQITNEDDLI